MPEKGKAVAKCSCLSFSDYIVGVFTGHLLNDNNKV
jgi:hypothetical protein